MNKQQTGFQPCTERSFVSMATREQERTGPYMSIRDLYTCAHQLVLMAPPIPRTVPINKAADNDCGVGRILPECNVVANMPITDPHANPAAAPWNFRPQLMGRSLRDIEEFLALVRSSQVQ